MSDEKGLPRRWGFPASEPAHGRNPGQEHVDLPDGPFFQYFIDGQVEPIFEGMEDYVSPSHHSSAGAGPAPHGGHAGGHRRNRVPWGDVGHGPNVVPLPVPSTQSSSNRTLSAIRTSELESQSIHLSQLSPLHPAVAYEYGYDNGSPDIGPSHGIGHLNSQGLGVRDADYSGSQAINDAEVHGSPMLPAGVPIFEHASSAGIPRYSPASMSLVASAPPSASARSPVYSSTVDYGSLPPVVAHAVHPEPEPEPPGMTPQDRLSTPEDINTQYTFHAASHRSYVSPPASAASSQPRRPSNRRENADLYPLMGPGPVRSESRIIRSHNRVAHEAAGNFGFERGDDRPVRRWPERADNERDEDEKDLDQVTWGVPPQLAVAGPAAPWHEPRQGGPERHQGGSASLARRLGNIARLWMDNRRQS